MTNYQESKLSMYLATRDFMTANSTIMTTLPNFAANQTAFQGAITQIQASSTLQVFDKTGIAANKGGAKKTLIGLAVDTARKVTAYAKLNNNQTLLAEVNYSESELKRFPDTTLRDAAQGIYDRAQSNLAALATYGITAASQTALQNAITAYNTEVPKPRLGITERKQATMLLASLFKTADGALDNIDVTVEIVRNTQPNFYNGYKTARKIVVTGAGSLAVKCVVTEVATGNPLPVATVKFVLEGALVLTKKTAAKGGFVVKTLAAGTYVVTASKPGYKEEVLQLYLSEGEMKELVFKMEGV
jgi:hypothetical protein